MEKFVAPFRWGIDYQVAAWTKYRRVLMSYLCGHGCFSCALPETSPAVSPDPIFSSTHLGRGDFSSLGL